MCLSSDAHANPTKSAASHWAAVGNAHAVLARSCGLNSPERRSAALANATKSAATCWAAVANAHAELARAYGLISPQRRSAALANATKKRRILLGCRRKRPRCVGEILRDVLAHVPL